MGKGADLVFKLGIGLAALAVAGWLVSDKIMESIDKYRLNQAQKELSDAQQTIAQKELLIQEKDSKINLLNARKAELEKTVATQSKEIERLNVAMQLLTIDTRIAEITCLEQREEKGGRILTLLRLFEVDPTGTPIGDPQYFWIIGDELYVHCWIVKFMDKYVQEHDILRGTSLAIFRRAFGNHQTPEQGTILDAPNSIPAPYAPDREVSDLVREVFGDFWKIAHDSKRAAELGIRAIHGEAVSMKLNMAYKYIVTIRASDGISIRAEKRNGPLLVDPSIKRPEPPK